MSGSGFISTGQAGWYRGDCLRPWWGEGFFYFYMPDGTTWWFLMKNKYDGDAK